MDEHAPYRATPADLPFLIALHRLPGIGPRLLGRLLARFKHAENVFRARRAALENLAGVSQELLDALAAGPDHAHLRQARAWLQSPSHHLLVPSDKDYPSLLTNIPDPPPLLYAAGDLKPLSVPQVAIVGSRNPSPGGVANARGLARALARSGFAITSGLAMGIDTAAHEGALAGGGMTIAVMGTGIDRIYPSCQETLAGNIAQGGVLVSEFPLGSPPSRNHFPRRNRIISGLAMGTVVIEAALHSGSLITARLAAEQGREVYAVPGSIHSPLSRGCHALLRDGAKLVETAQDIVDELRGYTVAPPPAPAPPAGPTLQQEHVRLLGLMGHDPISLETLISRSGLTAAKVSSMLLKMELKGLVLSYPGGMYVQAPQVQ